jgi:hypothetical protein
MHITIRCPNPSARGGQERRMAVGFDESGLGRKPSIVHAMIERGPSGGASPRFSSCEPACPARCLCS